MNRISIEKRARIIGLLVQGVSIRGISRLVDCSTGTIRKLQVDLGFACSIYQNEMLRDLPCQRLHCDDVRAFRGRGASSVAPGHQGEPAGGDVYAWSAIDAETGLIPSFRIGARSAASAHAFISDLVSRMAGAMRLGSDGRRACLTAVDEPSQGAIDYALLERLYGGEAPDAAAQRDGRTVAHGVPTPRLFQPKFFRPANAFDKKLEALDHAVALHTMHHNFAHLSASLRKTPAMAAGVDDHVWTLQDIALLAD